MTRRHVVLVGLPGSGKTTVGRLVAERLRAPFTDLDEVIVRQAGKSIGQIFAEDGEPVFRTLERSVGRDSLRAEPGVVATGGGFMGDAALRRAALATGLVVYLETSPSVAADRLRGTTDRPLLDGLDARTRMFQLLAQRETGYREAPECVTTDDLTPECVAERVAKLAREQGGW